MRAGFRGLLCASVVLFLYSAWCYAEESCPADGCPPNELQEVTLSVVACGERLNETLVMLKSALTLGAAPLSVHVFADEELHKGFEETLSEWAQLVTWKKFRYKLHRIQFPPGTENAWRKLFKPCACQRLFIPSILKDVDATIYVDTDTLFHRPPEALWNFFSHFNSTQFAALAPEGEDAATNWYTRFARHPFYPPFGVNSGVRAFHTLSDVGSLLHQVMLMNLTRMREFGWEALLWPLYTEFKRNLTWGDQDIINIIFSRYPEALLVFDCRWNYRPDHCMYRHVCPTAAKDGAYVVHGSRSYFHLDKQPAFRAVFAAWYRFSLGGEPVSLLADMRGSLAELGSLEGKAGNCVRVASVFTTALQRSLEAKAAPD